MHQDILYLLSQNDRLTAENERLEIIIEQWKLLVDAALDKTGSGAAERDKKGGRYTMDKKRIDELTEALRSIDEPPMRYGYDGHYKWHAEDIGKEAAAEIDHLTAKVEQLDAELAEYREADSCEYKIHIPAEEGYPDVRGRFYECSCGANYIDILAAQEWQYCPHCGERISSFETLTCISCQSAERDGDSYYCEAKDGMYCGEEITHANFDGCKYYVPREKAEAALEKEE